MAIIAFQLNRPSLSNFRSLNSVNASQVSTSGALIELPTNHTAVADTHVSVVVATPSVFETLNDFSSIAQGDLITVKGTDTVQTLIVTQLSPFTVELQSSNIEPGSIPGSALVTGSIPSGKYEAGSIVNADISSATVTEAKLDVAVQAKINVIKFSGKATLNSGLPTQDITLTGVVAGDGVSWGQSDTGVIPVTVSTVDPLTDKLRVTAVAGNFVDQVISYIVHGTYP